MCKGEYKAEFAECQARLAFTRCRRMMSPTLRGRGSTRCSFDLSAFSSRSPNMSTSTHAPAASVPSMSFSVTVQSVRRLQLRGASDERPDESAPLERVVRGAVHSCTTA